MTPWPNLFVVGASKAGTTSLHRYLDQHPAICMSRVKEPHFFSVQASPADPDAVPDDEDGYLGLWPDTGCRVRGESTTTYLHDPPVADRIHDRVPDARIVALLRDPIQRAYSHYWMHVAAGSEPRDFAEVVRDELDGDVAWRGYVGRSLYADGVRRFVDRFGADRVLVLLTAEMKDDAADVVRRVCRLVGVDPAPVDRMDVSRRHNTFTGVPIHGVVERIRTSDALGAVARTLLPKRVRDWIGNELLLADRPKPPIDPETKRRLAEVFGDDVTELEELLDRKLPELRESWS